MFSFGQFAHLLPYFLLAITSFAGWTTFNWVSKEEVNEASTEKELRVELDESTHKAVPTLFYFYQNMESESAYSNRKLNYCFFKKSDAFPPGGVNQFIFTRFIESIQNRPPPLACQV